MAFDRVIIVDWSARSAPSPRRPSADAIWIADTDTPGAAPQYLRTRAQAEAALRAAVQVARGKGQRLLIGFDFPLGYPLGFAQAMCGQAQARALWAQFAAGIRDNGGNANNRFAFASAINARFGNGPFWGCPAQAQTPHLPATKRVDYARLPFAEKRAVERLIPRAQPVWKLFTTGSVGSQSLLGLPMIHRLAQMPGVAVWPFDNDLGPVTLAEVYPALIDGAVMATLARRGAGDIKDAVQVQLLARAFLRQPAETWAKMLAQPHPDAREEGWILGAGFGADLAART